MPTYDAIVIGLGAMGSATAYHLARRGLRVLGIDRFEPCHDRGSSHGETRIIRKAYFEHPDYVPLLFRAYALWDELAAETGERLFERCGLLLAGPRDGKVVPGVHRAAAAHKLPLETLGSDDLGRWYPMFNLPTERYEAVFEKDAGFLDVQRCLSAHLSAAQRANATLLHNQRVLAWESDGRFVSVTTDHSTISAAALVICGGPWSDWMLADLRMPLTVRRKVQLWFITEDHRFDVASCAPVFGVETSEGFFYGFPSVHAGQIKIAHHTGGAIVKHADRVDRDLHDEDIAPVRGFIDGHLHGVTHEVARHSVCMYTMTPDEHFVLDRHPKFPNVVFAAGFSGHGFKFAPVVGEVMADLVETGLTDQPIDFLRWWRFAPF